MGICGIGSRGLKSIRGIFGNELFLCLFVLASFKVLNNFTFFVIVGSSWRIWLIFEKVDFFWIWLRFSWTLFFFLSYSVAFENGISTATYLRYSDAFTGHSPIFSCFVLWDSFTLDLFSSVLWGDLDLVLIWRDTANDSSALGDTRPLGS